jgi:hypothetical protein
MERTSGYTRQTVYTALKEVDDGRVTDVTVDRVQLGRHILITICAIGGSIPLQELANRLRLTPAQIEPGVLALVEQDLCKLDGPLGSENGELAASVVATERGFGVVLEMFDDLYLARPDGFGVYLRVDPTEQPRIEAAIDSVIGRHESTVLEPTVARSVMAGPELAMTVNAPTSRLALRIAHDVWQEVRDAAGLPPSTVQVADVIAPSPPPCGASDVLDAFVAAIIEQHPAKADDVGRERMRYAGDLGERALAERCLTSAARILRRSVGQQQDPRTINDSEAAWGELMPVRGLALDRERTPIKRAVEEALELAAGRLGPFVGGEVGSFRHAGSEPRRVQTVRPTTDDLVQMAELAGKAVGRADRMVDAVNAVEEVRRVVLP